MCVYLCVIKVSGSTADKEADDAGPQGELRRAASSNSTQILLPFSWKVPRI